MTDTPERKARRIIDANLEAAGWLVRSHDDLDLAAGSGIAVREFPMKPGFGTVFDPPDDSRKFSELYTVQRLATNAINPAAKVVITTIQRLYSMLKGDTEYDSGNEEDSAFDSPPSWYDRPPDVEYNPSISTPATPTLGSRQRESNSASCGR